MCLCVCLCAVPCCTWGCRYFIFQVVNVSLIMVLSGSVFNSISDIIDNPTSIGRPTRHRPPHGRNALRQVSTAAKATA